MWQALIELHWDRPLPLFFVGISLWIGAALSLDLVHSKEFHIWKALLGLTTLLALALPHFTISLVCVGFAALLGWLLAVRFFHYFQSWWIIVLGYELVRIHPVLLPHITSTVCLSLGLVAWVYGAFKAVSERSMRNVWGGWTLSQIGFIFVALVDSQIMNPILQYEMIGFGVFGTLLASLFNEEIKRFQSFLLSEWEGQHSFKKEFIFILSVLGLVGLSGRCGLILWQKEGYIIGLVFALGWLVLLLSYGRVAYYLFLNRSLRLELGNRS